MASGGNVFYYYERNLEQLQSWSSCQHLHRRWCFPSALLSPFLCSRLVKTQILSRRGGCHCKLTCPFLCRAGALLLPVQRNVLGMAVTFFNALHSDNSYNMSQMYFSILFSKCLLPFYHLFWFTFAYLHLCLPQQQQPLNYVFSSTWRSCLLSISLKLGRFLQQTTDGMHNVDRHFFFFFSSCVEFL